VARDTAHARGGEWQRGVRAAAPPARRRPSVGNEPGMASGMARASASLQADSPRLATAGGWVGGGGGGSPMHALALIGSLRSGSCTAADASLLSAQARTRRSPTTRG
jgi:hypothetical protein